MSKLRISNRNVSHTKKEKTKRSKLKPLDPLEVFGAEEEKNTKSEEFFNLAKFSKKKPPWPKSDIDGWKIKDGSSQAVKIVSPMIEKEYPLSKLAVWIEIEQDKQCEYTAMWKEIQALYLSVLDNPKALLVPEKSQLSRGQYVVIWHKDEKRFSRAVLKRWNKSEGTFLALSFDFNHYVTIKSDQIYPMCSKFIDLRPRATFFYMEGIHYFNRSPTLKKVFQSLTPQEVNWRRPFEFRVTGFHRVMQDKLSIFGTLFRKNPEDNVNLLLLEKLWVNAIPPSLPNPGVDRSRGYVVHAEKDGTIYLQLESPALYSLQDYCRAAKEKLSGVVSLQNDLELIKYKIVPPIDSNPEKIYMVHHQLRRKNDNSSKNKIDQDNENEKDNGAEKSMRFCRVQVVPGKKEKRTPGKLGGFVKMEWNNDVRFRFIDFGFEKTLKLSENLIVLSKKLHPLIWKVPPQIVKARLANIESLDVDRFFEEVLSDKAPVVVKTMVSASACEPAQVELYQVKQIAGESLNVFASVTKELLCKGVGQPFLSPKKVEAGAEKSGRQVKSRQLEYIRMCDTTDWSDRSVLSILPVDARQGAAGDDFIKIKKGERIWFFVRGAVISCKHFRIQPVHVREKVSEFSQMIWNHVSAEWIQAGIKRDFERKMFHPRWFYSYFYKKKGIYVRVRLVSAPETKKVTAENESWKDGNENKETPTRKVVKLLLIDFAEYVEVPVEDLILSIPLSVCGVGPMAAKVYRVKFDHSEPAPLSQTKDAKQSRSIFNERFAGKKCTAIVRSVKYDQLGMTQVQLERMQLASADE